MKLIDKEKIRNEIEKQFKAGDVVMHVSRHSAYSGLYLLGNPNDLSIGYSNADEPYQIALRNCTAASEDERIQFMRELNNNGYKWNECTLKIEKKEESGENLEAELKRYVYDPYFDLNGVAVKGATQYLTVEDVAEIARHFANWQKQQMMKDAMEVPLYSDGDSLTADYDFSHEGFKAGDKVKILIIKQEEE